jgi:DNA-binding NarL/FixJ family response regulator
MNKIPSLISSEATTTSYKDFDLSEKEFNIIKLVADGLNNKEIAESLFLGEGTVRNYISTILEKLDLRDRTQLAVFYYKNF